MDLHPITVSSNCEYCNPDLSFSWNEYPIALTWISDNSKPTLPVAMARIAGSSIHSVPYGALCSCNCTCAIPLILLVIVFQKPDHRTNQWSHQRMTLVLKSVGRKVGNNWIVKDLNFSVRQNECLVVVGPSGCGKSSTLRLIAGLDRCDHGSIKIDDRDITNLQPSERAIGMVFQSYALLPHLTVYENLELGLRVRGMRAEQRARRIQNILDIVQLSDRPNHLPSALSGGQRQRGK